MFFNVWGAYAPLRENRQSRGVFFEINIEVVQTNPRRPTTIPDIMNALPVIADDVLTRHPSGEVLVPWWSMWRPDIPYTPDNLPFNLVEQAPRFQRQAVGSLLDGMTPAADVFLSLRDTGPTNTAMRKEIGINTGDVLPLRTSKDYLDLIAMAMEIQESCARGWRSFLLAPRAAQATTAREVASAMESIASIALNTPKAIYTGKSFVDYLSADPKTVWDYSHTTCTSVAMVDLAGYTIWSRGLSGANWQQMTEHPMLVEGIESTKACRPWITSVALTTKMVGVDARNNRYNTALAVAMPENPADAALSLNDTFCRVLTVNGFLPVVNWADNIPFDSPENLTLEIRPNNIPLALCYQKNVLWHTNLQATQGQFDLNLARHATSVEMFNTLLSSTTRIHAFNDYYNRMATLPRTSEDVMAEIEVLPGVSNPQDYENQADAQYDALTSIAHWLATKMGFLSADDRNAESFKRNVPSMPLSIKSVPSSATIDYVRPLDINNQGHWPLIGAFSSTGHRALVRFAKSVNRQHLLNATDICTTWAGMMFDVFYKRTKIIQQTIKNLQLKAKKLIMLRQKLKTRV